MYILLVHLVTVYESCFILLLFYYHCYFFSYSWFYFFFLMFRRPPRSTRMTHSFPTRRSSDLKTAIWFAQIIGYEYRLVDYYENRGFALPHYLKVLQDRGYIYGTCWLPYDAENELLLAEHNIEQQVIAAGYRTRIVPKTSVVARINAARTIFNRCVFDEERTADGLNALRRWRFKVDPDTRQYSKEPQHDEYSHGGDAFTYMAVAMTEAKKSQKITYARSEEHTSELQSLMRISYAVFCLKKKNTTKKDTRMTMTTE